MRALIFTFDRLPKPMMSCYGGVQANWPLIDQLASRSIVFERHFAENVANDAWQYAWWYGRFSPLDSPSTNAEKSVIRLLRDHGMRTTLLTDRTDHDESVFNDFNEVVHETSPAELFAKGKRIISALKCDNAADWLAWVNTAGLHGTGGTTDDDPSGDGAGLQIGAESAEIDRWLEILLHQDGPVFAQENLLLAVTAGRGQLLTTRSALPDSCAQLAESVVGTPMFVANSAIEPGVRRFELTQSIDLSPTICDWFQCDIDRKSFHGQSLLPLLQSGARWNRSYVPLRDHNRAIGLRTADYVLVSEWNAPDAISTENVHMFIKPDDFWEICDVGPQDPREKERLTGVLNQFLKARQRSPLIWPDWPERVETGEAPALDQ